MFVSQGHLSPSILKALFSTQNGPPGIKQNLTNYVSFPNLIDQSLE